MLFLYFVTISFSLIGYGYVASKTLGIKTSNIGVVGILGIILLSIISFSSSIFEGMIIFLILFFIFWE